MPTITVKDTSYSITPPENFLVGVTNYSNNNKLLMAITNDQQRTTWHSLPLD